MWKATNYLRGKVNNSEDEYYLQSMVYTPGLDSIGVEGVDPKLIRDAEQVEIKQLMDRKTFRIVPRSTYLNSTEGKLVGTKMFCVNKGTVQQPVIKGRLVAQ